MRSAMSRSSSPSSAFTRAAAALIRPSQRATGDRDRLARDGEVRDRLLGLATPELLLLGRLRHRGESSCSMSDSRWSTSRSPTRRRYGLQPGRTSTPRRTGCRLAPAWDALEAALEDWRGGRTSWEHWGVPARRRARRSRGSSSVPVRDGRDRPRTSRPSSGSSPPPSRTARACSRPTSSSRRSSSRSSCRQHRGVTVRLVPAAELAGEIGPDIDVVAFSAVQMATGEVADLDAIAAAAARARRDDGRRRDAGGRLAPARREPLRRGRRPRLQVADVAARDGFMAIRPERLADVVPHAAGWYAGEDPLATFFGPPLRLAQSARRLDTSPAWFMWVATAPALATIERIGVEAIHEHDVALANRFRAGLGLEPSNSAIVFSDVEGAAGEARATRASRPPSAAAGCGRRGTSTTRWPTSSGRSTCCQAEKRSTLGSRGRQELVPGAELDARAAVRLAARCAPSASIASQPAYRTTSTPRSASSVVDAPLRPPRSGSSAGTRVLEQQLDRLGRVLLVRPDDAGRAALDPAGAVDARNGERPSSSSTRPPSFGIVPVDVVERHARQAARRGSRRCGRRRRTGSSRARRSAPRERCRARPARAGCGRSRPPRRARSPRIATGETRKRSRRCAAFPPALAKRTRAGSRRSAARCSSPPRARPRSPASSSSSAGSTTTSAPASSPSSCSSVDVHAACTGPRRPSTTISRMPEADDRLDRRRRSCRSARAPRGSARACGRRRARRFRSRSRRRARRRGRTRAPGSRGGRCTRRRARWRPTSRGDPRRGCRAGDRSARRRRRRPRRRATSSSWVTSRPTSTLPRKRKPGRCAIFSNARETVLSFGWSGATPSRTSPQGVGSRSIMSTSTAGSSLASRCPAA